MTMRDAIDTAIARLQERPGADASEIREELTAAGIDPGIADRIMVFIPIVLCRTVFSAAGVQFAQRYFAIGESGETLSEAVFRDDRVYVAVEAACRLLLANSQQAESYRLIAAGSAEYKAIMEMHLKQGADLTQLVLAPPSLNLPALESQPSEWPSTRHVRAGATATEAEMRDEAKAYLDIAAGKPQHPFLRKFLYEVTLLEYKLPGHAAVGFWVMQFRDQAVAALTWTDSVAQWRLGKWVPIAGKDRPIDIPIQYFSESVTAPSFQEALRLLESGRDAGAREKRPWLARLWRRPG